jgi:hypothetical protein
MHCLSQNAYSSWQQRNKQYLFVIPRAPTGYANIQGLSHVFELILHIITLAAINTLHISHHSEHFVCCSIFQIFATNGAVTSARNVFWNVTSCSYVDRHQRFVLPPASESEVYDDETVIVSSSSNSPLLPTDRRNWTYNATNQKLPQPAATLILICINYIHYVRHTLITF